MNTFKALNEARRETQRLIDSIVVKYSACKDGSPNESELAMSEMSADDMALYQSLWVVLSNLKDTTTHLTDMIVSDTDISLKTEYQAYCK